MATTSQAPAPTASRNGETDWRASTRVFLQPIAPPSILGLYGFAGATFIVAAYLAGWYGGPGSPHLLFPFAAMFGGLAQFLAGMWAYRARDGLATAMHGMWGSFWLAYGILQLLGTVGVVTIPATGKIPELGFWFLALAAITAVGAVASLAESIGLFSVLAPLAAGAAFAAVRYLTGTHGWEPVAGWVLLASSWTAFYVASAMMLESTFGRVILPLGKLRKEANIPGRTVTQPLEFVFGEPGVRHGQ